MAKADRLERADALRLELEADYVAAFTEALRVTAAGKWGLFDHNKDRRMQAAVAPTIDALAELADAINKARLQLDMDCFALHDEFLKARGPVGSHAVGEPKQAQAWLDRLGAGSARV